MDELDEAVVAAYEGFTTRLQCKSCKLSWPPIDEFIKCPGCGQPTDLEASKPVSVAVVNARLKNYASKADWARKQKYTDFETYYVKRETAILHEDLAAWAKQADQ